MRRPARWLVAAVTVPYLAGCFAVLPAPIPAAPEEREELNVRGVVVRSDTNDGDGERIEFGDIQRVTWTEDAVSILGVPRASEARSQLVEQRFPLSSLSAVLVRQVEPGKTSAIIGGTIVITAAVLAFLVSGIIDSEGPPGREPEQLHR